MKLNDTFIQLEVLRRKIGGREVSNTFDVPMEPLRAIERQLETTEGVTVERSEIQTVGPFLTYKGEILAILYIFNSTSSVKSLLENRAGLDGPPKFHFTWCQTLDRMTRDKRFERYVLSRSKSNRFMVEGIKIDQDKNTRYGKEVETVDDVRLYPCQNCLNELSYKGFNYGQSRESRYKQMEKFSIQEYLDENDGLLTVMKHLPKTLAKDAKKGGYSKDFPEISRRLREKHNWKCSECGIDMSTKKAGLHVHHVNGQKNDNSESNLRVLCALCHQNVDSFHKTMHIKPDIERFIKTHRP